MNHDPVASLTANPSSADRDWNKVVALLSGMPATGKTTICSFIHNFSGGRVVVKDLDDFTQPLILGYRNRMASPDEKAAGWQQASLRFVKSDDRVRFEAYRLYHTGTRINSKKEMNIVVSKKIADFVKSVPGMRKVVFCGLVYDEDMVPVPLRNRVYFMIIDNRQRMLQSINRALTRVGEYAAPSPQQCASISKGIAGHLAVSTSVDLFFGRKVKVVEALAIVGPRLNIDYVTLIRQLEEQRVTIESAVARKIMLMDSVSGCRSLVATIKYALDIASEFPDNISVDEIGLN